MAAYVNPGGLMQRTRPRPNSPLIHTPAGGWLLGDPHAPTIQGSAPRTLGTSGTHPPLIHTPAGGVLLGDPHAPTILQTPGTSGTTVTNPSPAAPPAAPPLSTDPRDWIYKQNVEGHTAGVNKQIAGWQKQQTDAANLLPTFDYHNSYTLPTGGFGGPAAELAQKHAADVLAQQIAANRRGALYSTGLAQAIGGVDQTYQDKYKTAVTSYGNLAARIAELTTGAQTGDIEYGGGQLADAAGRAATAAANNPALGFPTTPLVNDQYLIRGGAAAPAYTLTPPKGAPKGARWSGGAKPPGSWRGIGGGWWAPSGGK